MTLIELKLLPNTTEKAKYSAKYIHENVIKTWEFNVQMDDNGQVPVEQVLGKLATVSEELKKALNINDTLVRKIA